MATTQPTAARTTSPDAEPVDVRPPRRKVRRSRRFVLGTLSRDARARLSDEAFAVYDEYKAGVDRAAFDRIYFSDDEAIVGRFDDGAGGCAGFVWTRIARVAHEGHTYSVVSASLFVAPGFDAASEATRFCIAEALRFKLRAPRVPLAYMGIITSPASYRRFALQLPTVYPSRLAPTPAWVETVVMKLARARGLEFVDEANWIVRSTGHARHPERIRKSRTLQDDPDARFWMERNPDFEQGTAMLIWVPLDFAEMARALGRYLTGRR